MVKAQAKTKQRAVVKPSKNGSTAKNGKAKTSTIETLLAGWPPLSDSHREAFRALVPGSACDALGQQTKSEAVLREAIAWCVAIDGALRENGFALRRYAPPRFVWLLECVAALEEAVRAQKRTAVGDDARRHIKDRAHAHAREVRDDLLVALEVVAAGRADAEGRIATIPTDDDAASLAKGLRALADLADELGRAYDARTRALVASVTLRAEDAHAARAAAAMIEAADSPAPLPGAGDLAVTNRIEGRVLAEMAFARRMFDRVRAKSPKLPKLAAGPGTRAALG